MKNKTTTKRPAIAVAVKSNNTNIVNNKIVEVKSTYTHASKDDKAYVAKLSKPTAKYDFDRTFLTKNTVLSSDNFTFKWDIEEVGAYEMKELNSNGVVETSIFAINKAGDRINLANKKQAKCLVFSSVEAWMHLSGLKLQLFALKSVI